MDDNDKEKRIDAQGEAEEGKKEKHHEHEHEEHKKKKKKEEVGDEMKTALEEKEKQLEEFRQKLLYQQADFENFKKLKAREKQEVLRFGD